MVHQWQVNDTGSERAFAPEDDIGISNGFKRRFRGTDTMPEEP